MSNMKECTICKVAKDLEEFQKKARSKDGRTSLCKPCKREYDNEYYKNNERRRLDQRVRNARQLEKLKRYVKDYLAEHPCVDCGEPDVIVLEFDHVRGEKVGNISDIVRAKKSMTMLKAEIEKCEVRCANCHRRVTVARRQGELL